MVMGAISFFQNIFKPKTIQDLKLSNKFVTRLSLPDHTKQFIFAIPVPESQSIVYILATQNLSQQSALDAELLIKQVQPEVVVAQVAPSAIHSDEDHLVTTRSVPTSFLGVLRGCFLDKVNKDKYESLAGSLVLKEIFGIGLYGHVAAAKAAAKEVGANVLLIESNYHSQQQQQPQSDEGVKNSIQSVSRRRLNSSNLIPQSNVVGSVLGSSSSSMRLCLSSNDLQSQTLKSVIVSALAQLNSRHTMPGSLSEGGDCEPMPHYETPSFAQSVYPLLIDLHNIFTDLPLIGRALSNAQKMLCRVEKGETIDNQLLFGVLTFRVAVEGLRIGLNRAACRPIDKKEIPTTCEFSELPMEDKSHALFAQAIRSQTKKFKSVVAIVDASSLLGIRKHWNTPLPPDVEDVIEQFVTEYEGEGDAGLEKKDRKQKIPSTPVVALGAGATAIVGASSLSKVAPVSTVMKVVACKVPASLKLGLIQTQKVVTIALSKILGPSKVIAPGIASSGAKTTSVMKASASAERIRTVAHSVIASVERTSFSAMRTAFYEIMRKRRVQPLGSTPWAAFGCSVATCAGLLVYGDGIVCAAESIPVAPTVASLGRGLQSLHHTSQAVGQSSGTRIKDTIQSLMYR